MPIDVNPRPDISPEDQEILRKVYQAQMDAYKAEYEPAKERLDKAEDAVDEARTEWELASTAAYRLEGRMDALREIAARDGIQLD